MPSVNQELQDVAISHAVRLHHYSNTAEAQIRRLLAQMNDDLGKRIAALGKAKDPVRLAQLEKLRIEVRAVMDHYSSEIAGDLGDDMESLAKYEADYWTRKLQDVVPIDWSISSPSPDQLLTAATATPFQGALMEQSVKSFGDALVRDLNGAMNLGFAEGDTVAELMRRIRGSRASGYTDGVLQGIGAPRARALARTSIQSIAAKARAEVFRQNDDLVREVQWVATLDTSTCIQCGDLDGRTFPVDQAPEIPLHWNCRCTLVPVVKSWEELGLDAQDIAPGVRASMDGEVPDSQTFGQWLGKQSEDAQLEVLGPRRYALWKAGEPLSSFAQARAQSISLDDLMAG